ncbi:urease accessory protein [Mesorhizobium sp. J18]|nr:urease accessory protein [Mesorhizobium sp. J18]
MFGREAMGETVRTGLIHDRWRIRRDGRLLFADDLRFDGEIAAMAQHPATLGGKRAMATILLVSSEGDRLLAPLREAIGEAGGASAWDGKLLARIAAADSLSLRRSLIPALTILLDGRALPKVWQI